MPIYLRNFYYRKLVDVRKKEDEANNKSNTPANYPKSLDRPNIPRRNK